MTDDTDRELAAVERWFVARGLPHLVERRASVWDMWGRAIPPLVVGYLLLGLNALDIHNWSWQRNVLVGCGVVASLVVTWIVANRLRGRPSLERPSAVGPAELAIFVVASSLPSAIVGQWGDFVKSLLEGTGLLALIWFVASYGIGSIAGWALERTVAQLAVFGNVIIRALPLLLLFMMTLFLNAEVWQVAGQLAGPAYVVAVGIFFGLGVVFLLSRLPPLLRHLNAFATWQDVAEQLEPDAAVRLYDGAACVPDGRPLIDRPSARQRFNIGLVALFPQAIQITFAAVAMTGFFVVFGLLTITGETIAGWTTVADVHTFATIDFGGRQLVLTEPLVRVSAFLGAFTGMYFTVVLSTDSTYREEFTEDIGPELRQALAVRVVYRQALAGHDGRGGDFHD